MPMTELSQVIFDKFQVRKTRKQKDAFIHLLHSYIPELKVQELGFPKSRNLILGDPEAAKVVLGAHYDTCAQLPFPNFITPKRPLLSILYSFLVVVPYIAVIVLLNHVLTYFIHNFWVHYWVCLAAYALLMCGMLVGPANKHTANDNTSGVITLLEIYQALSDEQKKQVCFVFFDNEEKGVIGSTQFRKKYKQAFKTKLLINYDCVSDGDNFLFGISKKANQKYYVPLSRAFTSTGCKTTMFESLKKVYYPSDQAGFPVAIAVAALKHKKPFGYYMDKIHTKHDTEFNWENIAYLTAHTVKFIESIEGRD